MRAKSAAIMTCLRRMRSLTTPDRGPMNVCGSTCKTSASATDPARLISNPCLNATSQVPYGFANLDQGNPYTLSVKETAPYQLPGGKLYPQCGQKPYPSRPSGRTYHFRDQ